VKAGEGRYADCARTIGVADLSDSDTKAVRKLVDALFERNQELEVPSPKTFGISGVEKRALIRTGKRRHARDALNLNGGSIKEETVIREEIASGEGS
jgi:hypothetical protein